MSSGRRGDRISGNTDIDRSLVGAMNWALLGTLHAQCGLENDLIHEVLRKKRHMLLADYNFLNWSSDCKFASTTSHIPEVLACSPYMDYWSGLRECRIKAITQGLRRRRT